MPIILRMLRFIGSKWFTCGYEVIKVEYKCVHEGAQFKCNTLYLKVE